MNKRGLIITIVGLVLVGVSLTVASSAIPSNVTGPNDLSMVAMFDGMFDEVTDELQIMPGESAYVSYGTSSYNSPLLWGIQLIEYETGDMLSIMITNIFGDSTGEYIQSEPILFEMIETVESDTLNFEIKNIGQNTVYVIVMFSEDPENSDALSNPNSPLMNMVLPLLISGFLLILGIIISIIGTIIILVDLKNDLDNKRNY
jgi:hypothetical protein